MPLPGRTMGAYHRTDGPVPGHADREVPWSFTTVPDILRAIMTTSDKSDINKHRVQDGGPFRRRGSPHVTGFLGRHRKTL